jgi:hypothetical protein
MRASAPISEIFAGESTTWQWYAEAARSDAVMSGRAPTHQHHRSAQTDANLRSLSTQDQLALGSPSAATSAPRAQPILATLVPAQARATDMARAAMQQGEDARTLLTHSLSLRHCMSKY